MPWLLGFLSKGLIKWGLISVALVGILWKAYDLGGDRVRALWDLERAHLEGAHAAEVARLAEVEKDVTRKYLKLQTQLRNETKTIIEKVPVYVTKEDDANCNIPDGFVRLHDEAAGSGPVPNPGTSTGTDDTSQPVELSDVGRTVAGNYSTCRETALRLEQLQEWVKKIAQ